jgi:hypothetical protein
MKLSIKELKDVLECAEKEDKDDELPFDWDEKYKCITIYFNDYAWRKFTEILTAEECEE